MITIATNMAGRGTDIVLGGNIEKQHERRSGRRSLDDADKDAQIAALKAEVAAGARTPCSRPAACT